MSDRIADVLEDAADIIERDGWHQGSGQSETGARCAVNAISASAIRRRESSSFFLRPVRAVEEAVGCSTLAQWNDEPGRTKQEVLDALRLTAKTERMLSI